MSETPNEGAGVSVEGQDEREWTVECENYVWHAKATAGDSYPKQAAPVEVVPKSRLDAALVGAEARERELERTKERLSEALDESQRWADRWARLENRPLIEVAEERAEKAEAREAVLVEALKEAEGELRRIADVVDPEVDAPLLLATADRIAALAGVVEAERDDLAQEHRDLDAAAAYEASEGKYGRPQAEPDGRTDG